LCIPFVVLFYAEKMKNILIVTILLLFVINSLLAQSDKNRYLQGIDPKLLERIDVSKIPESPNLHDKYGKRMGQWTIWLTKTHVETTIEENVFLYRIANFKEGDYIGIAKDYELNGKLVAEGMLKDAKWDGMIKFYGHDQKLEKEVEYKDGKEGGAWIKYKNGKKIIEGFFHDGKRAGNWNGFYPSGKKKFTGDYILGGRHGLWFKWDESGNVKALNYYDEGKEKSYSDILKIFQTSALSIRLDQGKKYLDILSEFVKHGLVKKESDLQGMLLAEGIYYKMAGDFSKSSKKFDELEAKIADKKSEGFAKVSIEHVKLYLLQKKYTEALGKIKGLEPILSNQFSEATMKSLILTSLHCYLNTENNEKAAEIFKGIAFINFITPILKNEIKSMRYIEKLNGYLFPKEYFTFSKVYGREMTFLYAWYLENIGQRIDCAEVYFFYTENIKFIISINETKPAKVRNEKSEDNHLVQASINIDKAQNYYGAVVKKEMPKIRKVLNTYGNSISYYLALCDLNDYLKRLRKSDIYPDIKKDAMEYLKRNGLENSDYVGLFK
jgi:antitoxin component YwqK of YwqJK toxin-antitoxin module